MKQGYSSCFDCGDDKCHMNCGPVIETSNNFDPLKGALKEFVQDVEQLLTPIQDASLPTDKIIEYFQKSLQRAKEALND